MKAVIMAGGLGKRAESIDSSVPKPLIKINGKPILQWEIECLVEQGLSDIILTVSYKAEQIKAFFGDGGSFGCKIGYYIEEQPLGNAGALFKLWESGELDGDFLLLNADSMFNIDFGRFMGFHQSHDALATLFTHPNNHPYDSGLVIADNDVVKQWLTKEDERPKWYKNCVNAGLHILNTELLKITGIDAGSVDSSHKVDLDRDILKPLVSTNRIYAYNSPEYVKDMGTPERFEQVQKDLSLGLVSLRNLHNPQKAIFLDRDGTINRYVGFLRDIEDFELIDGVSEAIKLINASGYLCFVVSNQPVIARGEVTTAQLDQIHCKMETLLGQAGAYVDGIYICPHHPDSGFAGEVVELKGPCDCRKPKPGLIYRAAKDYNISVADSWMIGDSWRDVECGHKAGCRTILLNGVETERDSHPCNPDYTAPDLLSSVKMILG